MSAHTARQRDSLAQKVKKATGTSPSACYQCGRCSAGCPQNLKNEMDLSPTRVLRLLQLEDALGADGGKYLERLLGADTPWLCAGCQACTTRCPQGVDIAGVMDVLRQEAMERGMASRSSRAKKIQALHDVFLKSAVGRGRMHEVMLVALYKMKSHDFFGDLLLGPAMFIRGKLHLMPPKGVDMSRAQKVIRRLRDRKATASRKESHS
jgi:heterodisulfide reductase subunit C